MHSIGKRGFTFLALASLILGLESFQTTHDSIDQLVTGFSHHIIYIEKLDKTILVNGCDEGATTNKGVELWEWTKNSWKLISNSGPIARNWFAVAYNSKRGELYLYGGSGKDRVQNDFWKWDGLKWHQLSATPGPRAYAKMVYDRKRDRVVLFGGDKNENNIVNETWEWDGVGWTQFSGTSPENRLPGAMTYDQDRQRIVLYGGLFFTPTFQRTDYNDTWEYDGNRWMKMNNGALPKTKIHPDLVFHPEKKRIWLVGGSIDGSSGNETWEWNGEGWNHVSINAMPSPRSGLSMTYDNGLQKLILHGGFTKPGGKPGNDTWILDGEKWSCVGNCK